MKIIRVTLALLVVSFAVAFTCRVSPSVTTGADGTNPIPAPGIFEWGAGHVFPIRVGA